MTANEIMRTLNVSQILALRHLCVQHGSSAIQLSRAAGLSAAAITGLKDKFIKLGLLLERRDTQDRRKLLLHATDLGREVLREADLMLAA